MNFLAPLFLLGGLALAGPIIFHLVRRATREKTRFSSLMFLLPSPPRLSRQHRLEHLLLLILRCAALALLAFGFARPFLRQPPADDPAAGQPRRILVLLDTSASMRRDGVWPAATERVKEILRRAGPADQVAVYTFAQQARGLVAFDDWNRAVPGERVALATGRLGTVAPSWEGTHLGTALVTAAEVLDEEEGRRTPGPRQIILVSDVQAGSRLDALQAYEWPKGIDLLIEAVAARLPTNAGVQVVADAPDVVRAAGAPVRVRVTNSTEAKREQFKVGWVRRGPAAGAAPDFVATPLDVYVPPGQSRSFSVPVPREAAGLTQIALTGDDDPFDNSVFFIPPVQQKPMILWLGADVAEDTRQPLFFLRRAFAETPRVAARVVASAPAAPLAPADLAGAGLIFATEALPTETAAALRAQMDAGRTVVFVTKKADSAVGATLGVLAGREPIALREAQPSSYAMFGEINFQHPLFAPFADPRYSDFTKIHFWRYRKLLAGDLPGARTVAAFDTGDPALLEVPVGRGKLYVLASGWQPDDSQLAVSSKFVPLLWSLLESSGAVDSLPTSYTVGEPLTIPAQSTAITVRGPDGEIVASEAGAKTLPPVRVPGVYELSSGARQWRVAVNLDPNESRTTPLGPDELEHLGVPVSRNARPVAVATENKTLLQAMETENRQKLWRWFVLATLAVLLAESAIAGWTARRAARASAEAPS